MTRLARALRASGVEPGDRVAYLCPNIPALIAAHFAVPLAGAVLVAINTRLAPAEVRTICDHSGARLLVADTELADRVAPVRDALETVAEVAWVDDLGLGAPAGDPGYADLLDRGSDEPLPFTVEDEDATISINYTSGTTGRPKGVMYTHRGAYLNALGENLVAGHDQRTAYLWTLPMFHCNGWCHPWAIAAAGGLQVCLRAVRGDAAWRLIHEERITHLCGAPPVLSALVNAPEAAPLEHELVIMTAAAPPNPAVLARLEGLGVRIVHVYGLTETYGPYTVCQPQVGWEGQEPAARARLLARQGVAMHIADPVRVVDEDMRDVPRDGATVGEVVMRGNDVMKGYYRDPEGTEQAFRGGWFHSGDLGVQAPGRLRRAARPGQGRGHLRRREHLDDRGRAGHPLPPGRAGGGGGGRARRALGRAAQGLRRAAPGADLGADDLLAHVRGLLAGYKCPDHVAFVDELPKTSTGKVQKHVLREREWAGRESRIN